MPKRPRPLISCSWIREKYSSNLLAMPSHSAASIGGVFFAMMFGHFPAYSAFGANHLSIPGLLADLITSRGCAHAAIDAFVRVNNNHVLAFIEAVDGARFDAIHSLHLKQVSLTTHVMALPRAFRPIHSFAFFASATINTESTLFLDRTILLYNSTICQPERPPGGSDATAAQRKSPGS
jgi:hypothetical protein